MTLVFFILQQSSNKKLTNGEFHFYCPSTIRSLFLSIKNWVIWTNFSPTTINLWRNHQLKKSLMHISLLQQSVSKTYLINLKMTKRYYQKHKSKRKRYSKSDIEEEGDTIDDLAMIRQMMKMNPMINMKLSSLHSCKYNYALPLGYSVHVKIWRGVMGALFLN